MRYTHGEMEGISYMMGTITGLYHLINFALLLLVEFFLNLHLSYLQNNAYSSMFS